MSKNITTNYLNGLTLSNPAYSPVYISPGVTIAGPGTAALTNGVAYFWQVTNGPAAQINGGLFGVSLSGAGSVTNLGLVTASYSGGNGITYDPSTKVLGILSAGVFVGGGGISNASTGTIRGGAVGLALGGPGSLVNAGAIGNTVTTAGFGVALTSGGSVTNQSGGDISGGRYGILTDGNAYLTNQSGGVVYGGVRGIFMINGAGSVENQGSINGSQYSGVQLAIGGHVSNLVGGAISGAGFGVLIAHALGTVTNQGGIVGGNRGVAIYYANGTVTNQGSIEGSSVFGVYLSDGGTVTNEQGGSIGGGDAGVYMTGGGNITNQQGGSIVGGDGGIIVVGAVGSVINQGFIQGTVPYSGQTFALGGVLLLKGGSVSNNSGGTITGSSYGVDIAGTIGTVTNAGSINNTRPTGGAGVLLVQGGSVGNSGTITTHGYGVFAVYAAATVTNSGLIAGYITLGGAGAALLHGGSVTNNQGGLIVSKWIGVQDGLFPSNGNVSTMAAAMTLDNSGVISAGDGLGNGAAVWVHGPGVVINRAGGVIEGSTNGTIVGGPLNGLLNGGFGVVAYYQTTLINYGSIGGNKSFIASNKTTPIGNRVEMAPGASFGGVVLGAHNAASASLSTLELLSGASVGTVTNFGTKYANFGNILLDNGARWVLGGTVAAGTIVSFAGAGELTLTSQVEVQGTIDNFSKNDTIVIDGIVVTGSSFFNGVLTLNEATGGPATLNLAGGAFTTSDFTVTNVAGNAEITVVQTLNRTLSWTGSANASFGNAANWNDLSNGFNPAGAAPNQTDTVQFNTSGGAVNGTGTVAVLDVGTAGSGSLQLSGGATIVAGSLDAGVISTAVGQIGLTDTGTALTILGSATIADDGTGVLSVLSGATFTANNLTIGSLGDSSGALVVSGAGSVINVAGSLNIGTALGTGDVTVGPGAAIHAGVVNLEGQAVLEGGLLDPTVQLINQGQTAGGFGTIAAGDIVDEGVIQAGANKASQKLLLVQGTILGGGTLTVNGSQPGSNPAGVLQINAGGTMELTGPVINAATTTFTDNLTPTGTYTVNNSVVDVSFADAAGVLKLDDIAGFGGTITTHQGGDSFLITGGTLSSLNVVNGNTLTFADSGAGAGVGGIDDIIFASQISAAGFRIVNSNTVQVACFAAGTRIQTSKGPVGVEHLTPAMHVTTRDGDTAEIVWIGQREVDCRQHPNPASVSPIRVLAGAFGPGLPSRDLLLSPDHAVFIEGVLIPVHCLINNETICQIDVPTVTYYHVELPEHDVILAEDLPVESYLDTDDRSNFSNAGGAVRLFPDFTARMWEMAGCAERVMTGPILERVRQTLARTHAVTPTPRASWARLNNRYTYY